MLNVVGEKREFEASTEMLAVWGGSYTGPSLGGAFRLWSARDPAAIAPMHTATTATTVRPSKLRMPSAEGGSLRPPWPPMHPRIPARRASTRIRWSVHAEHRLAPLAAAVPSESPSPRTRVLSSLGAIVSPPTQRIAHGQLSVAPKPFSGCTGTRRGAPRGRFERTIA